MPVVNYDWDELEDNIVEEFDDAGNTIAEYTTEPDLFGNVISQNREGVESQFHFDALGSTLAVTDENQNVTDTRAYSAFGTISEAIGMRFLSIVFVGRRGYHWNPGTSTYYARARHYRDMSARWMSVDPIRTIVLSDRYRYASNNPTGYIDPAGLQSAPSNAENSDSGDKAADCKCGEKRVLIGDIKIYTKVEDVELKENVDGTIDLAKTKRFTRKPTLVDRGSAVQVVISGHGYRVLCCKNGDIMTLAEKEVNNEYATSRTFTIPTPPGPPTRGNMEKVAKCVHPVVFAWTTDESGDANKCLALAFENIRFGPRSIEKGTDLDSCGKEQ